MKRKRSAGAAMGVLSAAQSGGDPVRNQYVNHLHKKNRDRPKAHIATSHLSIPSGRSAARHIIKGGGDGSVAGKGIHPGSHFHDLMRKFNRGKSIDGIRSHRIAFIG